MALQEHRSADTLQVLQDRLTQQHSLGLKGIDGNSFCCRFSSRAPLLPELNNRLL